MDCPLRDFINATADAVSGEELARAFRDDPVRVGEEHGLSCEQIVILLHGDPDKIREALVKEGCVESNQYQWTPYGLTKG